MNVLDLLLLLSCLYWALLLMSFGRIGARLGAAWLCLMLLPPLLWTLCLTAIVKSVSLVHAVANIDLDIIGLIQEATDEEAYEAIRDEALASFRGRMLDKIGASADREGKLFVCFNNFDLTGAGRLSYQELRLLTRHLNIHMTLATFDFLFRSLDSKCDNVIDFEELRDAVFPDLKKDANADSGGQTTRKTIAGRITTVLGGGAKDKLDVVPGTKLRQTHLVGPPAKAPGGGADTKVLEVVPGTKMRGTHLVRK